MSNLLKFGFIRDTLTIESEVEYGKIYLNQLAILLSELSNGRMQLMVEELPAALGINKGGTAINYLIYKPVLTYMIEGKESKFEIMVTKGIERLDIGELAGVIADKEEEIIAKSMIRFSIADISNMALSPKALWEGGQLKGIMDAIRIFRSDSTLRFQAIAVGKNISLIGNVLNMLHNVTKFINPDSKIGFLDKFRLVSNLEEAVKIFIENFERIIQEEN